jgi:hypothetical protein
MHVRTLKLLPGATVAMHHDHIFFDRIDDANTKHSEQQMLKLVSPWYLNREKRGSNII